MRYRFVAHVCILSILAAMPLSAQTINGCVDTNKGTLRIVKPGEPCDNKEYAISWNSAGVNGTNGKDGINGVNGLNGTNGKDGRDGLNCEAQAPPAPVQIATVTIAGLGTTSAVYQFAGGAKNTAVFGGGGGGGVGKADFTPIIIVRKTDASSPKLFESVATGLHFATVTIDFTPTRFVKLTDVVVSGYQITPIAGSSDFFETITFDYAKIDFKFDAGEFCYDLLMNKKTC